MLDAFHLQEEDDDARREPLIRSEIFSAERLEQHAESLAQAQIVADSLFDSKKIEKRLRENDRILRDAYHALSRAIVESSEIPPAAEWLIDNYFVLEEQVRNIRNDLPPSYYRQLPKLADGHLAGYPRVYGITWAYIAHTDSFFNPGLLGKFVQAYQRKKPLNISELWAIAVTLRIALVENLRRAASLVVEDRKARARADLVAERLLKIADNDKRALERAAKTIDQVPLSSAFVVQLIQRLRDQSPHIITLLQRIDERLHKKGSSAEEIVRLEHQKQVGLTVTVRNIIISMRSVSTFDWVEFFENVSLVDKKLRERSHFAKMDLPTRNLYRHAIERLAYRSSKSELDVTDEALKAAGLVENASAVLPIDIATREQDPGYFLIDKGRIALEKTIRYRPTIGDRLRRMHTAVNFTAYILANIFLVTSIIELGLAETVRHKYSFEILLLLSAAVFFPAWEAAITLINRLAMALFKPTILPGLALRDGIPDSFRAAVVVPTLLSSEAEITEMVKQLEVHYLSNSESDLCFVLLSDWKDADAEQTPQDEALLDFAKKQIAEANNRHLSTAETPRFLILHRRRLWNPSQGKWMGWERKRGKLHEFNKLLRGAADTSFLVDPAITAQLPKNIRYVVTLDADTRLPRGSVKRLVGKLAHPLNRARIDPKLGYVVEGYGILQPRVSSSLPERRSNSVFQRILYSASGIDPYAFAISDVYQDVFDEGSFTGKGIYDLDIFEQAASSRIPENLVLSHDLLEGNFARAGLASDIEVIEEFPSRYDVAAIRQHRWARGDWQLLPWIFGKFSSSVPSLGHWKMLDNLRRTFTAPFTFLAFLIGWTFPLGAASLWTALIIGTFTMPLLLSFIEGLVPRPGMSKSSYMLNVARDGWHTAQQILLIITFLPHQAWLMVDAIGRTVWRLYFSHRNLLEWITAAEAKVRTKRNLAGFYSYMSGGIVLTVIAIIALILAKSVMWPLAAPLLCLWLASPAIAYYASQPGVIRKQQPLNKDERQQYRLIARETWGFFEKFVTPAENMLPPDNFQEDPQPVVAHRTSPTNIGLYLLSTIAAQDFGWLGMADMLERAEKTFVTLGRMERFRGHLYNWYDTTNLRPLSPRYISSVDSGNFAGNLIIVSHMGRKAGSRPIINMNWAEGVYDAVLLAEQALANASTTIESISRQHLEKDLADIKTILQRAQIGAVTLEGSYQDLKELNRLAASADDASATFYAERGGREKGDADVQGWVQKVRQSVQTHCRDLDLFAPWLALLPNDLHIEGSNSLIQFLGGPPPTFTQVRQLPEHVEKLIAAFKSESDQLGIDLARLEVRLQQASQAAQIFIDKAQSIGETSRRFFDEMDFHFLLDPQRQLLSIGYQVENNVLDPSCYDLLASEARLASIIAIAKGDIPAHNWFRLGRTVTSVRQRPVLVSWSGSMFEYLMPTLIMREPDESLIGQTNRMVVKRQISYGEERGIPWGVSESAYNARDFEFTYQYSSFGVPGLGLKRGLSENIVIAPYATALAAMIAPHEALKNLQKIAAMGGHGAYGWYEALDFTSKRLPEGESVAIVRAYMAHHQGMSLISIQNILQNGRMRERFHAEPMIQATELLLQEVPPRNVALAHPRSEEVEAVSHIREISPTPPRCFRSPHGPTPRTHLLSNGEYAVMVTTAGSGYSQWRGASITRWREDPTRDNWGSYIYIRDLKDGKTWSAAYQPTCVEPDSYNVAFLEDRAEIARRDGKLSTVLNVVVSSEDHGEVRRISITNQDDDPREIELTSFAELSLTGAAADEAHPVFSKLFVETEYDTDAGALLATRRLRTPEEKPIWAVHLVTVGGAIIGNLQYETDRMKFIGRNRTARNPQALDGRPLSDTVGTVLDPIFSLRCRVRLEPGTVTHVSFWTLTATSREQALELADKYRSPSAYHRAAARSWTQAQLQYQHLGIAPEEAHLFQRLANHLIYSDRSLRPNSETIKRGANAQSILWSIGVSGDLPIVIMRIDVSSDLKTLRQLVKAHSYWSSKRLEADLVILNEQPTSYLESLQSEIETLVRTSQALPRAYSEGVKGNIFILRGDQMTPEARGALHAAARAVIVGHRGSLAEQLAFQNKDDIAPVPSRHRRFVPKPVPSRIAKPNLEFFNGIGGFADQGREYVMVLEPGQMTPAPWINVIANPAFGFHVSAEGSGYSWALNSRENKLTPWSNDPVSDEPGEVIYLRDLESGAVWTPTAAPIRRTEATYLARHGMGYSQFETSIYGIESELTQFVPSKDPIKISRLKIRNKSGLWRRLSVTSYVEWVLAPMRRTPSALVTTEIDPDSGTMLVSNRWNSAFGNRTGFAHIYGGNLSWTGDRNEFIGRNGALHNPVALTQGRTLSGKVGAGYDPCSALQTIVELKPGQEIEIIAVIGEVGTPEEARKLVADYEMTDFDKLLGEVKNSWLEKLGQIQVATPDAATNIMLNGWLVYQTIVCRVWARSAFYQTSGAYGYRDQLQDVMTLALIQPKATRDHLLRAASRQFPEGDVQHWWLPSSQDAGRGVRTRFTDDPVWLVYVTCYYVGVTGDAGVLDEEVPFLEGPVLKEEEHESFFMPKESDRSVTLFEHCALAIDKTLTAGQHGITLFGGGDWNDGMNRVGIKGQGESVWLAWFLLNSIKEFSPLALDRDPERVSKWVAYAAKLKTALEDAGWDGEWYRRGYFDDGAPLGSASSSECRIDSIAQSWAVISGQGDLERQIRAMKAVENYLIKQDEGLALLFTPPFDKTSHDPGYIKGYPPGIRENGGQYTHAAIWTVIAQAQMGDGDKAFATYAMLNPINHTSSRAATYRYKVEPYSIAADIYANPQHIGRGGWTWYTGSAGWMYRAGLESLLGFKLKGTYLQIDPCIPKNWTGYEITYRYKSSTYFIKVNNSAGVNRGIQKVELDGRDLGCDFGIPLVDDGGQHAVRIEMGAKA